jgi:hypothetical protein
MGQSRLFAYPPTKIQCETDTCCYRGQMSRQAGAQIIGTMCMMLLSNSYCRYYYDGADSSSLANSSSVNASILAASM